jgi:hypothetical protein
MLYSRDGQRALIGELLEATRIPAAGPLVIRSVPGVGKSRLLLDTRERTTDM